jgi:hypothetical protein
LQPAAKVGDRVFRNCSGSPIAEVAEVGLPPMANDDHRFLANLQVQEWQAFV